MIGKVYYSVVEFYDVRQRATRKKVRPVLIVGGPQENDYTVLPISTISRREHLNPRYDLPISPEQREALQLPKECFIRTHKQLTVHRASLQKCRGDMKNDLPELYLEALARMEEFQKLLIENSI